MTELPDDYKKYSAFMVVKGELPFSVHLELGSAEKVRDSIPNATILPLLSVA